MYVLAAERQGKYEEMSNKIFANYRNLKSNEDLPREYAQELGLDMVQFDKDMQDPALEARIDKEMNQANSLQKRNFQYLKRLLKCPAKDAINCNREIVEGTSYLPVTTRMISFSNPEVRGLEVFVKTANMGKETINILMPACSDA